MAAASYDQSSARGAAAALTAPSPNHGDRRGSWSTTGPDMIVVHFTDMPSAADALARLRDPAAEVSAHYLIERSGRLHALVDERRRAWHAGASQWGGESDVNSRSIGVELDHPGERMKDRDEIIPFAEPQMRTLEGLLGEIRARWAIPPKRVLGHSDVAPGRKIDPGWAFDWPRLAALGHALAPSMAGSAPAAPAAPDRRRFRAALRRIGYGDWPDAALLDAFRRRFHRWTGVGRAAAAADPTAVEIAVAAALAEAAPATVVEGPNETGAA